MSYLQAVGFSILPNIGGIIGGLISKSQIKSKNGSVSWYETLNRPSWCPPNWVFGPVWTTIYTSMGYASYLVWRDGGNSHLPLITYGTQLALNWAWTPLFFRAHSLKWSLIDIGLLYGNVILCGGLFYKINRLAGCLFIPYIAWMTLATALNYCIWRDNRDDDKLKIKE